MASPVAFFRPPVPCPCLTKKLTVIGTIGQTQGITSANKPPIAEAIRNGIKPCWAFWAISLTTTGSDFGAGDVVVAGTAASLGWSLVSLRSELSGFRSAWAGSAACDAEGFAAAAVLGPWGSAGKTISTASG